MMSERVVETVVNSNIGSFSFNFLASSCQNKTTAINPTMSVFYHFLDWFQTTLALVVCCAVAFMACYMGYHSYPKLKKKFNVVLFTSNLVITLYLIAGIAFLTNQLANSILNLNANGYGSRSNGENDADRISLGLSLSCYWTAQSTTILLFMLRFNYVFNTQVYTVSTKIMTVLIRLCIIMCILCVYAMLFVLDFAEGIIILITGLSAMGVWFLLYIGLSITLLILFTKEINKILSFKAKETNELSDDLLNVVIKSNILVPGSLISSICFVVLWTIHSIYGNYDGRDEGGVIWLSIDCFVSSLIIFLLFQFHVNVRCYQKLCRKCHRKCRQKQSEKFGIKRQRSSTFEQVAPKSPTSPKSPKSLKSVPSDTNTFGKTTTKSKSGSGQSGHSGRSDDESGQQQSTGSGGNGVSKEAASGTQTLTQVDSNSGDEAGVPGLKNTRSNARSEVASSDLKLSMLGATSVESDAESGNNKNESRISNANLSALSAPSHVDSDVSDQ